MENAEEKFIDPKKIIDQLDFRQGDMVADFGCGTGFFSFPIAKKIGERGTVYSLDVLPQVIEAIESQAKLDGLKNIVTKRVNLEKVGGSTLEGESLDWVILKDVLYQNQKKDILINEAKRILKKGGKVLVVEWKKENSMIGPEKSIRISREEILEITKNDKWEISSEAIDAGKFHYAFVLIK